jgi:hypothetical protein
LTFILFTSALLCLLLLSEASAHSPLSPGNNESLETATPISDPTKSWAVYAELHEGGEAQYYRFDINQGQKIHVMLYKSPNPEDGEFLSGFVLMGPGITTQDNVPSYVEVPSGAKTLVVEGKQPDQATYEPFSPSIFYSLADLTLDAPSTGTYYIAVYEPSRGGHYGLAVGDRESYTLEEWIFIPLNLISVYQWEGQSLIVIFAPLAVTVVVGLGLMIWWQRNKAAAPALLDWIPTLAGLLFLGTGINVLFQMIMGLTQTALVPEIAVTIILALAPILLGIGVLRIVLRSAGKVDRRKRIYLAILGIVALFLWAGLLVGPALAIVASVLPVQFKGSSKAQP